MLWWALQVGAFFTSIPQCVLGGMTTFLFAGVCVSGIKVTLQESPMLALLSNAALDFSKSTIFRIPSTNRRGLMNSKKLALSGIDPSITALMLPVTACDAGILSSESGCASQAHHCSTFCIQSAHKKTAVTWASMANPMQVSEHTTIHPVCCIISCCCWYIS